MAMRVAALYDVHGNTRAWNPWPRETLERVQSLGDRARFVRGNWERYLLEGKDEWTAQHVPAATADAMRRSGMPEAEELAGELLQPPMVAQLLERLG